MIGTIAYFSFIIDESSSIQNIKNGLIFLCLVFLLYSWLQFRDSIYMFRPLPGIWRIVRGLGILYLLFLVFLLFQVI
jgi:hypothetical protein